jgi:hypothetical protein
MGVSTNYLGHFEIVPSLNQAEYDYLHAFARSRRSYRPEGPYAVSPEDPHAEGVIYDRAAAARRNPRNEDRERSNTGMCVLCVYGPHEHLPT